MKSIFPPTTKRVKLHTNSYMNEKIQNDTLDSIAIHLGKSREEIEKRIMELDREWDIERLLQANASALIVIGALLGFNVNRKWFALSGVVGAFLLQHALQGWCPPVELYRRLGIRTCSEINYERDILRDLCKRS